MVGSFVGRFLLAVVVMGFVEVYLLINAARWVGFLATAGLCVLTGVVGGSLVRHQGLRTLQGIQGSMAEGRVPAQEIVSGVVLLMVGVLLITPGFVTDVIGFSLLIPPVRLAVAGLIVRSLERRVSVSGIGFGGIHPADGSGFPFSSAEPQGRGKARRPRGRIIDVEPEGPSKPPHGTDNDG